MTTNQVVKREESVSVRFMNMVIKEFTSSIGAPALTNFQKRLAQNYFIAVDQALAAAEQKRKLKKKNQDPLPVTWANIDMKQLALDVVAAARVGLDPAQANHISMIPFKNNSKNKYDIAFIEGYRGMELKATKYGLDIPDHVTVELVYSNDHFKPIKKDHRNRIESYEFDIPNPFDRGEIVGGFYYHAYTENPTKNKLVIFTKADILKRKPEYATPEFWGGEKDEYKNGQKTGNKIKVEGWFKEMCWKTIYRAAYRDITIDSQKIDDAYLRLKRMEDEYADRVFDAEVEENANQEIIDVEYKDVPDEQKDDSEGNGQKETENIPTENDSVKVEPGQQQAIFEGGPGF